MESAANNMSEVHKRRTSRIVQAMPLTVSGVDALGRPFQERTSTLIINCHGCRYQSKHYVLKNMWVSLEVPHPEPGHEPRVSRARVTWIQRPRTVRELFQVGVELETPGNLWGIAFAPPDWFSPSEAASAEVSGLAAAEPISESAAPAAAEWTPLSEPASEENNLRTMPLAGALDPSLALTRQMARLVNEAKRQLHDAIRESASQAVALEARPLLAAIQSQAREAAERSVEAAAAPAAEQALRNALAQAEQTGEAQLQAARERWNRDLGEHIEQTGGQLSERFSAIANERAGAFENQLETRVNLTLEKAERAAGDLDLKLAEAQKTISEFAQKACDSTAAALQEAGQQLQWKTEQARGQLADLDQTAQQLQERVASAADAAHSGWQARLDADLATATGRWNQHIETSLENAALQAAQRLAHHSRETSLQAESEISARIAAMGATFAEASAIAESKLESLRIALADETARAQAALAQMQSAAQGMAEWSARVGEITSTAQQELERRAAHLVETQSQELANRAEQNIAAWTDRLQPALEAAGQQIVVRLGAELDQQMNARLDRAGQALADLDRGTAAAEIALRSHQEAVAKVSEREIETALGRLQTSMDQLEHNFGESGRAATAKWLAELDAKATEATHTTFESLYKTADWYEKKVQNQMQSTLEKGLEQAGGTLREKAGEISGLFATELDHYSRSYVEHTQGQIEEGGREALERIDKQAAEMAATSAASLVQQVRNQSEEALAEFHSKSAASVEQVHSALEAQTRQASAEFSAALQQQTQQTLGGATKDLASQVASAADQVRLAGEMAGQQLRQSMAAVSDDAVDEYKKRLESASNSWLLTTASKLNQQSEQHIEKVARATEERLRETCNQVFSDLGETLRLRMLALFGATESGKSASQSE